MRYSSLLLARLVTPSNAPALTRGRVWGSYAVAGVADLLQLILGPFGWAFADELIDLIAAGLTYALLGFHPLLLPTFVIEILPVADMLPTWTACVALVIASRKHRQAPVPPPPGPGQVIDV